jgi:hypothetical protein
MISMNDIDSWNDIEELELMLKEPTAFGIYPETEQGRKRYAELEAEHKKLVEQHRKQYVEAETHSKYPGINTMDVEVFTNELDYAVKPMPGDVVRVLTSDDVLIKVGSYGVIEGVEGETEEEYSVCFNCSPFPWWDNGVINSSGGPVRRIKASRLKATGQQKEHQFQRWRNGIAGANRGEVYVRTVNVFEVDLPASWKEP